MSAATTMVAVQNRYLRRFKKAGATTPDAAVHLHHIGCRDTWLFRRMVSKGVFVNTPDGRFYMAPGAAEAFRRIRRKRLLIALGGALVLILIWRSVAGF